MIFRNALLAIATSTALICSQSFAQAPTPVRIRGEITAVDATTLTVRRQGGETVQIALKPDQAVGSVKNLLVGKRVFMIATGVSPNLSAGRITVEKDGVAPPM